MKPHHWPFVAFGVGFAVAITIVVLRGGESPALNALITIGIPLVAMYLMYLVSERVPNQVRFEFRAVVKPREYTDMIEVTGSGLKINAGSAAKIPVLTYEFGDLIGIGMRQAAQGEAPWITLKDGRALPVPPGDVVVLRTTTGDRVLPVENPRKFVSLMRSRVPSLSDATSVAVITNDVGAEAGKAPRPVGPPATPVDGPAVSLTGPPLAVRWLVGATLALTGTVVLPAVALITIPEVPRLVLAVPLIAGVVWVLNRNVPRIWSRVAFLAVPLSVFWSIKDGYLWIPVLLVLCPTLGNLGGRMFRLGANLGTKVEVAVPLRTLASLYVQRDRLVYTFDDGGIPPQAMWLHELTLVQPGTVPDRERWPMPGGIERVVGNGPTLRLVAGPLQWMLPVTQAGELAELIRSRQETLTQPHQPTRISVQEWRELRGWAEGRISWLDLGNELTGGIRWRLVAASFTGQFAGMFLLLAAWKGFTVWPGILGTVVLTVWLLGGWWQARRRMRLAEVNVLPPGSRDWGETRPDHAPVYGWQPWR